MQMNLCMKLRNELEFDGKLNTQNSTLRSHARTAQCRVSNIIPPWKLAIYGGTVRTAFDAGRYITRASGRGLGPGNRDFFGAPNGTVTYLKQYSGAWKHIYFVVIFLVGVAGSATGGQAAARERLPESGAERPQSGLPDRREQPGGPRRRHSRRLRRPLLLTHSRFPI